MKHIGLKCLDCGTVLISLYKHHLVSCSCPNEAFIDGGFDYRFYGAVNLAHTKKIEVDVDDDVIKA